MHEYGKALEAYEKALQEVEKHFGKNISYAVLCENCAAVCQCLGDKEKQQAYLQSAAQIREAGR